MVSTYPPTRCGLATFTAALVDALVALDPARHIGVLDVAESPRPAFSDKIIGHLGAGNPRMLDRAVTALHRFDVVVIQHEYGIFPGPDGASVLDLLDRLERPVITVLHTVLADPTPSQRAILEAVIAKSAAAVVMTQTARARLLERYSVNRTKVRVISHGAAVPRRWLPRQPGARPTMLTWGLLGPGKGIEHAIDALSELRSLRPQPRYVIAGQTHPKVRGRTGDSYRDMLEARATSRGVRHLLDFADRYLDKPTLMSMIQQADVVVLPYESTEQVTSGVLVDAVACGSPVVATAFPHAVELLSRGAGITVQHGSTEALAAALGQVLDVPEIAADLRLGAQRLAPELSWHAVAKRYVGLARDVTSVLREAVA
jgi:polysaccharide biosynthesis protein PslF